MATRDKTYADLWYEKLQERAAPGDAAAAAIGSVFGVSPGDTGLPVPTNVALATNVRSLIVTWENPDPDSTVFYEVLISEVASMANPRTFTTADTRLEFLEAVQFQPYFVKLRTRLGELAGPFTAVFSTEAGKTATEDIALGACSAIVAITDFSTISVPSGVVTYTDLEAITFDGTGNTFVVEYSDLYVIHPDNFIQPTGTGITPIATPSFDQFASITTLINLVNNTDVTETTLLDLDAAFLGWLSYFGENLSRFNYDVLNNPIAISSFDTVVGKNYTIKAQTRSTVSSTTTLPSLPFDSVGRTFFLKEILR